MKGIMEESLLAWTLNGQRQTPFLCSEGDAEALLLGHMVASGLVEEPEKVQSVSFDNGLWQVQAALSSQAQLSALTRLDALPPLKSPLTLPASDIIACCEQVMSLDHAAGLHAILQQVMSLDHAAGLHAILLSDGEKTSLGRDIGRHNAVEKAVGNALQNGLALNRAVLASSGRLSLEMLAKAAFARVPILVTKKQVGSLCVNYAERLGMTVCRLEEKLSPLSHPERVQGE